MKLGLFYNVQASKITSSEWLGSFYNFIPNIFEMIKQGIWEVLFKQSTSYNPTLWTMYYEFYGSFIVLAFAFIVGRVKYRYILYIVALFVTMKTNFLPFIFGLILSDLYSTKENFVKKYNRKYINIIILIIGLFLASYPPNMPVENTIYNFMKINLIQNVSYFYHSIGSFLLMIVLLNSVKLKKFFQTKLFNFLGAISFSLYITHFLILNSFSSYLFIQLSPFFRYYQVFLIVLIISISMILFISYYVYKYIDLGGIKLSKYLYKKYFCKVQNNKVEK